jgi:hypothetical protein
MHAPWNGVKLLFCTGPLIAPDATHGLASFKKDKTFTMKKAGSSRNFSRVILLFIFVIALLMVSGVLFKETEQL